MPLSSAELTAASEAAILAADAGATLLGGYLRERHIDGANHGAQVGGMTHDSAVSAAIEYSPSQCERRCMEAILGILELHTPRYGLVSRLSTNDKNALRNDEQPIWVVNCADGAINLERGLAECCLSIALVVAQEPMLGVVAAPCLDTVYCAVKGRGAFRNGTRIHVSPTDSLGRAVIYVAQDPADRSPDAVGEVQSLLALQRELACIPVHSIRALGCAGLAMCFIAAGHGEVYIEPNLAVWDYAAGTVILREAGGIVHDMDNVKSFGILQGCVCCGNSLALIRQVAAMASKHHYNVQ